MSLDAQTMEKYLLRAIAEFDTNPLATNLMRRLAAEAPEVFLPLAMKQLVSAEASSAHRLLAILLMRQDSLLEYLATPSLQSLDRAVRLFRKFLEVDPSFDVRMAHKLPGRGQIGRPGAFDGIHSARALEILDLTSPGRLLLPILGHLPESADNRISSKATLFVGRRVQSPAWTKKQLARPDQRIRANAVEALWGAEGSNSVLILEECATDANHRVAGNSLMGLHIAGREDAQREALSMSRRSRPEDRSAAAWVMGKIGTPAFMVRLAELVRDEHSMVRGTALRGLIEARRAAGPAAPPPLPEEVAAVSSQAGDPPC